MSSFEHRGGKFVGFKPLQETFSYYALSDGQILGVKPSLVKVFRIIGTDGKPLIDANGQPVYGYTTQNVTQVLTPAEYKEVKTRMVEP